jgi:hypothetical protein
MRFGSLLQHRHDLLGRAASAVQHDEQGQQAGVLDLWHIHEAVSDLTEAKPVQAEACRISNR